MNATYVLNNGYIQEVRVEAQYRRRSQVPQIGQRRRMVIAGASELLTLNKLDVERLAEWSEGKGRFHYKYRAVEVWGEYFIS